VGERNTVGASVALNANEDGIEMEIDDNEAEDETDDDNNVDE
jgi:hypothetical protein